MRHIPTVLIALLASAALAQTGLPANQSAKDPIRITAFPEAVFRLVQGGSSSTVRLQGDIAGCTTGTYDGSDPKSKPEGGAASTRVLDMVQKGSLWFVVFQTSLGSGCNVQGRCGAGTAVSVVWLKLDAKLKLLAKQAVIVEECLTDTGLVRWAGRKRDEARDADYPLLEMRSGVLEVVFERDDYTEKVKTVSTLVYDRRSPERGFQLAQKQFALK